MTLRGRARKALLSLHVGTSVALIGTTSSVMLVAATASGAEAHAHFASLRVLVFALAIPLSFTSLITGVLLGVGTHWGVLRHGWVAAKLALQLGIILTGALAVRPWLDASLAATAAGAGPGPERWLIVAAGALNLAMAATAVGLGVFKPRRRVAPA
jgi:hypothetical protein